MEKSVPVRLIQTTTNQQLDYRILVVIDESPVSRECLELLSKMNCPIRTVFHLTTIVDVDPATLEDPDAWSSSGLDLWRQVLRNDIDAQQINARQILARANAMLSKLQLCAQIETHVLVGSLSDALQDLLQKIRPDLILIGSDFDSPLRGVGTSKFSLILARNYSCPVIVMAQSCSVNGVTVRLETGSGDAEVFRDLLDMLPRDEAQTQTAANVPTI